MLRRGAAATAKRPDTAIGQLLHLVRKGIRADEIDRLPVVIFRQAGVWLHDKRLCGAGGEARQQGNKLFRANAAVAADGIDTRFFQRGNDGLNRLSRHEPARRALGQRAEYGKTRAKCFRGLDANECFIQRAHGFNQDAVRAGGNARLDLFAKIFRRFFFGEIAQWL